MPQIKHAIIKRTISGTAFLQKPRSSISFAFIDSYLINPNINYVFLGLNLVLSNFKKTTHVFLAFFCRPSLLD